MINKLQIEQEIVRVIEKITGIENSNIRISYQTTGMPSIEVDTDYCFVALSFFNSAFTSPIETKFDAINEIEHYQATRGIVANLVFYGLNAFENASKVKIMTKDSSIMKNLRKEQIYLICDTEEPRRVPVLINQQWYDQVYLDLRFYQKIMYNTDRHYIDSVEVKVFAEQYDEDFTISKEEN